MTPVRTEAKGTSIIRAPDTLITDAAEESSAQVGARVLAYEDDVLIAKREGGSEYRVTLRKYDVVSRGGKGFQLFTRGAIESEVYQEPEIPIFPEE